MKPLLPIIIHKAINRVLKNNPYYKTKRGAKGQCVIASDHLIKELRNLNDGKFLDAWMTVESVAHLELETIRLHHWVMIRMDNVIWQVDLTARQFRANAACPKVTKITVEEYTKTISGGFKTSFPLAITTVEEAKTFLTDLYNNGESFHCEDDAKDIAWNFKATIAQCNHLNKLMEDIYNLPGNDGKHDNSIAFCPCGFLLNLDPEYRAMQELETINN